MQGAVTITTPTGAAPEGHNEAMEQRFDAGAAAAVAGTGYVAPEAAPAGSPAEPTAKPESATPAATPDTAGAEGFIDGLLKDTGLTRDGLATEFSAGGLSDGSYAKLATKGIDRATVDQFLGGVKAQASAATAAYESEVYAAAGSKEKYTELVSWAKGALSAEEIDTYNEAVNSGNAKLAAFAVAGLQARHTVANPAEPSLINKGAPSGGATGYESWAQVKADMKDPKYAADPAYRAQVAERLRVSPNLS